ncbi:MAG: hypothetical protein AVO38_03855 [delta proteobacterium ML8_D]|jgi:hypothetical protein|nr:MAG: hypothetical protein AVO38_03855 [delta proteobacterium ML8_D]
MFELEKFTLRIDPSSVYFFRFILEGYDNMYLLSTVDPDEGLVEVRAVKGSIKDLFLVLKSLKTAIGLNRMDSRADSRINETADDLGIEQ